MKIFNNNKRLRQYLTFPMGIIMLTLLSFPAFSSSTKMFYQRQKQRRISTLLSSSGSSPFVVPSGGASTIMKRKYYPKAEDGTTVPSTRMATPTTPSNVKLSTDGASIPNMIFNLVKSIVGAGVLGLPAGIAAFGSTKLALVPSIVLISIIGILSGYCFSLIGRICAYTSSVSYRQAWERSVSSKSSWIPAVACLMVTSCSVLAYSMILSDTIPTLLSAFTPYTGVTRSQALLGVTVIALLPLSLMKSLKALGPFSMVGIIGMVYTSLAMAWRYFDGSYREGGKFVLTIPPNLAPSFAENGSSSTLVDLLFNPKLFVLVSMLSTAYMVRQFWLLNFGCTTRSTHNILHFASRLTKGALQCQQVLLGT
jgi:hypothetical protein